MNGLCLDSVISYEGAYLNRERHLRFRSEPSKDWLYFLTITDADLMLVEEWPMEV